MEVELDSDLQQLRASMQLESRKSFDKLKEEALKAEMAIALTQELIIFEQNEALVREESLSRAHQTQIRQKLMREKLKERQQQERKESSERRQMKSLEAKLRNKLKASQSQILNLQAGQTEQLIHEEKLQRMRSRFSKRMQRKELDGWKEKNFLFESQERKTKNLLRLEELQMKFWDGSEEDKRYLLKEQEKRKEQILNLRRKEAEHLREFQLLQVKHMTQEFEQEVITLMELEKLTAAQNVEMDQLQASQMEDSQEERYRMKYKVNEIKDLHILEIQLKESRDIRITYDREARESGAGQKESARVRRRAKMMDLHAKYKDYFDTDYIDKGSEDFKDAGSATSESSDAILEKQLIKEEERERKREIERKKELEQRTREMKVLQELHKKQIDDQISEDDKRLELLDNEQKAARLALEKRHLKEQTNMQLRSNDDLRELKAQKETEVFALKKGHIAELQKIKDQQEKDMEEFRFKLKLEKKYEELLMNIMPKTVAQKLRDGAKIISDHFASVTILFIDMVGFTNIVAEKSPTEVVTLLNDIFTFFDELVAKYEVTKIKTIGDAYMVAAGVPSPMQDGCAVIGNLALEMKEKFPQKFSGMNIRLGFHTGEVVAGVIGINRPSYDIWGSAVNLAARMEQTGVPGAVQVTEKVYQLLKHRFTFEARGEITIKGFGPMKTYLLTCRGVEKLKK